MPNPNLSNYSGSDYDSEILSKEIFKYLIEGQGFNLDDLVWDDSDIADVDDLIDKWKKDVDPVTIEELTTREVGGSGAFDAIMESIHNHLKREYDSGRIIGSEYVTAYVQLTEASLTQAVRFAIDKNKAYWDAIMAQAQAITAAINAQIAKIRAKVEFYRIKAEALKTASDFSLTTMKLATEDAQHELVCKQKELTEEQINTQVQQTSLVNRQVTLTEKQTLTEIQREELTRQQAALTKEQIATQIEQTALVHEQTATQVQQTKLVHEQGRLTEEQVNTQVQQTALTNRQITLTEQQTLHEMQKILLTKQQTVLTGEQAALTKKQTLHEEKKTTLTEKQTLTEEKQPALVVAQTGLATAQKANTEADTKIKTQQELLYKHQVTTNDPNGTGEKNIDFLTKKSNKLVLDSQKALYDQQKTSYQRNDERKIAELFSSTFTALKAIDEGYKDPGVFTKNYTNQVIGKCTVNAELHTDPNPPDPNP